MAKEHDNPTSTYEGVLLGSILERAGVPRGEKLRGKALRAIVVITASSRKLRRQAGDDGRR